MGVRARLRRQFTAARVAFALGSEWVTVEDAANGNVLVLLPLSNNRPYIAREHLPMGLPPDEIERRAAQIWDIETELPF